MIEDTIVDIKYLSSKTIIESQKIKTFIVLNYALLNSKRYNIYQMIR